MPSLSAPFVHTPVAAGRAGWERRARMVPVVLVAGVGVATVAPGVAPAAAAESVGAARARVEQLGAERGVYGRIAVGASFGRGLRFNNPYRLRTQLGDTAESLSLTAPYVDPAVTMAFGDPDGFQHGGALHLSFALEGVSQQAMSATYQLSYTRWRPLLLHGRLGPSLLTSPDTNLGGELAGGAVWLLTGVFGITVELVGSLFYGAGTEVATHTVYPLLSAQAGLVADFEVLP